MDETYLLLDENLTPANKPLSHSLMVKDHYEALKYIISLAYQKTKLDLNNLQKTSALILKNSRGLISSMGGDFDSSKGEFRKTTVRADNRTFIDYKKVPDKTSELLNFTNTSVNKKMVL